MTAVTAVPSFSHGSSSSPGVHRSPLAPPLSAQTNTPIIREPVAIESPIPVIKIDVCAVTDPAPTEPCSSPASSPTSAPVTQVSSEPIATESPTPVTINAPAGKLPTDPTPITPPPSSAVWAKTLELAKKKLIENKLPPLDLTNIASQSACDNIEAVVKSLNAIQEDEQRKRWSYTWHGKEVVIAERLGKILRSVEKYSHIVGTAIQCDPQVGALVWAGVQGIIRVCIFFYLWANYQY